MYDSVQIRKTFIQTGMFMIMMINVHCTRTLFSEIFFFKTLTNSIFQNLGVFEVQS